MSGFTIIDKIIIDFDLLIKETKNGKDYPRCNINGDAAYNVRPLFGEHERTIIPPGQDIQVITKPAKSDFTISEYPEFFICPKHRISSTKDNRPGLEDGSEGSVDIC